MLCIVSNCPKVMSNKHVKKSGNLIKLLHFSVTFLNMAYDSIDDFPYHKLSLSIPLWLLYTDNPILIFFLIKM